jgi:hypothetical protein
MSEYVPKTKAFWMVLLQKVLGFSKHEAHAIFQEHIAPLRGTRDGEWFVFNALMFMPRCLKHHLLETARGL